MSCFSLGNLCGSLSEKLSFSCNCSKTVVIEQGAGSSGESISQFAAEDFDLTQFSERFHSIASGASAPASVNQINPKQEIDRKIQWLGEQLLGANPLDMSSRLEYVLTVSGVDLKKNYQKNKPLSAEQNKSLIEQVNKVKKFGSLALVAWKIVREHKLKWDEMASHIPKEALRIFKKKLSVFYPDSITGKDSFARVDIAIKKIFIEVIGLYPKAFLKAGAKYEPWDVRERKTSIDGTVDSSTPNLENNVGAFGNTPFLEVKRLSHPSIPEGHPSGVLVTHEGTQVSPLTLHRHIQSVPQAHLIRRIEDLREAKESAHSAPQSYLRKEQEDWEHEDLRHYNIPPDPVNRGADADLRHSRTLSQDYMDAPRPDTRELRSSHSSEPSRNDRQGRIGSQYSKKSSPGQSSQASRELELNVDEDGELNPDRVEEESHLYLDRLNKRSIQQPKKNSPRQSSRAALRIDQAIYTQEGASRHQDPKLRSPPSIVTTPRSPPKAQGRHSRAPKSADLSVFNGRELTGEKSSQDELSILNKQIKKHQDSR